VHVSEFLASVVTASQLGLEVNTPLGHAYMIPRWNKHAGAYEATLQIGYLGFIELARRSGKLRSIYAHCVWPDDRFHYQLGLRRDLVHEPRDWEERTEAHLCYAYAVAHVEGAEPDFEVLTKAQVLQRRDRGGYDPKKVSPWKTDFEQMAQKTAIRALWRWLPRSAEMAKAEMVDVSSDLGRSPTALLEEEQTRMLARGGVYVDPQHDEPEEDDDSKSDQFNEATPHHDPETGEVFEGAPPTDYTPASDSEWESGFKGGPK